MKLIEHSHLADCAYLWLQKGEMHCIFYGLFYKPCGAARAE